MAHLKDVLVPTCPSDVPAALEVRSITLTFGGVTSLNDVSFVVAPRAIHALIGPNGAGKSSCLNVICRLYSPERGQVVLNGLDVSRVKPSRLAALGIGRAFQNLALSPESTVLDNVMLGRHSITSGGFLREGLGWIPNRRQERRHAERAAEICEFFGIASLLYRRMSSLSYGDAKRVDLARAVATEPSLLLFDEPAAGMNATETAELALTIRDLRDGLGIAILLVEHDMGLVMSVADHVTVLDFGRVVAEGPPAQVQDDPDVIRAYLGAPENEGASN